MTADLNNPYAPPTEVTEPPWSLPPDTEFLFNDEVIAAVGILTLPKICVLTGRRTQLIEKTTTLRASPFWHVTLAVVVNFGLIAGVVGFLLAFALQPVAVAPWNVGVVFTVLSSIVIVMMRRRTLTLTWFIDEREFENVEWRRQRSILLFGSLAILNFVVSLATGRLPVFEVTVVVAVLLLLSFRAIRVLRPAGSYENFVLVKGFKAPFINELRRMIEAHEERAQLASKSNLSANEKSMISGPGTFPS